MVREGRDATERIEEKRRRGCGGEEVGFGDDREMRGVRREEVVQEPDGDGRVNNWPRQFRNGSLLSISSLDPLDRDQSSARLCRFAISRADDSDESIPGIVDRERLVVLDVDGTHSIDGEGRG